MNSVSKKDPYDYVGSAGGLSTCLNFDLHWVVTGLVLGGFVNLVILKVQILCVSSLSLSGVFDKGLDDEIRKDMIAG